MGDLSGLPADNGGELLIPVAQGIDGNPPQEVEITPAVLVKERAALAVGEAQGDAVPVGVHIMRFILFNDPLNICHRAPPICP